MAANLIIALLGAWGVHYTWTRRARAGSSLFLDLASPVRNPKMYAFAIGLRLAIFGACLAAGVYRILFGIVD